MNNPQKWLCPQCEATGEVPVEPDEGDQSVVNRIEAAHQLQSPECATPIGRLVLVDYRRTLVFVCKPDAFRRETH